MVSSCVPWYYAAAILTSGKETRWFHSQAWCFDGDSWNAELTWTPLLLHVVVGLLHAVSPAGLSNFLHGGFGLQENKVAVASLFKG